MTANVRKRMDHSTRRTDGGAGASGRRLGATARGLGATGTRGKEKPSTDQSMRITVGGKTWNLRYVPRMNNRGECDYGPRILRIRRGQQEHEELDTLIHEL